jgi:hypothetical protein
LPSTAQPTSLPATAAQVKEGWTFLGPSMGLAYIQPAAQQTKTTKVAWDAVILDPPLAIGGKQILGSFYLREYDCAGERERVLYWARLGDSDVRWNQTRPSAWTMAYDLTGDVHMKRYETVCPPPAQ